MSRRRPATRLRHRRRCEAASCGSGCSPGRRFCSACWYRLPLAFRLVIDDARETMNGHLFKGLRRRARCWLIDHPGAAA